MLKTQTKSHSPWVTWLYPCLSSAKPRARCFLAWMLADFSCHGTWHWSRERHCSGWYCTCHLTSLCLCPYLQNGLVSKALLCPRQWAGRPPHFDEWFLSSCREYGQNTTLGCQLFQGQHQLWRATSPEALTSPEQPTSSDWVRRRHKVLAISAQQGINWLAAVTAAFPNG